MATTRLCRPVQDHELRKFTDDSKVRVSAGICQVGVQGTLTLTADVAAKVEVTPGSPLANRQLVVIDNDSGSDIYWGYVGVTTTTGITVFKKSQATIEIDPVTHVDIYVISSSTVTIRILEG